MKCLLVVLLVLLCISSAYSRQSWYYADNANNYHPPYDLNQNSQQNTAGSCPSNYACITPSGAYVTPVQTTNYLYNISGSCPIPGWVTAQGNYAYAVRGFDACCGSYQRCLQTCGVSKDFCDGQFYGCTYATCSPTYILRPGDRVYCHAFSACYASYTTRSSTCGAYQASQTGACSCPSGSTFTTTANNGGTVGSLSGSTAPFVLASSSPAPSRTPASAIPSASLSSFVSTSTSPSATAASANLGKRQATSESATFTPPAASQTTYDSAFYGNGWGSYYVRPIPSWDGGNGGNVAAFSDRCPPYFNNYVNVMTDQEMDDVNYWGGRESSGSSMVNWMNAY